MFEPYDLAEHEWLTSRGPTSFARDPSTWDRAQSIGRPVVTVFGVIAQPDSQFLEEGHGRARECFRDLKKGRGVA